MKCHICSSKTDHFETSKILNKYDVPFFLCKNCGFLQPQDPFWLDEAYQESINTTDTGMLARNISLSKITSMLIFTFFNKSDVFLDYAGGYGILTRLMRDAGFDFYWHDPFTKNILAKGFDFKSNEKQPELVTCFEAFEHFVNPLEEIEKISKISDNILFSTVLLPNPVPSLSNWMYYGVEHGQHISFYSYKTLKFLAKKFNYHLYSDKKQIHLFSKRKLNPLMFRLIVTLSRLGFHILIKIFIKSKTCADSQKLSALMKEQNQTIQS